jgi:chromosome partitioning protein
MIVTAMTNQKGGVGKTTTTLNLAAALARKGYRVLVVDFDPQHHLSHCCGLTVELTVEICFPTVLLNVELHTPETLASLPVQWLDGVDVVPSNLRMVNTERLLYGERGREARLKTLVEMWAATGQWDICLVDCPPSLALLSDNALVAADQLIIPVESEDSSLHALDLLMAQLSSIRKELRIDPEILGLVVNAYDKRRGYEVTSTYEAMEQFPLPILATVKDLADMRRAWRAGQSVFDIDPDGAAAASYNRLADALIAPEPVAA